MLRLTVTEVSWQFSPMSASARIAQARYRSFSTED
jgi:hypothetical protein